MGITSLLIRYRRHLSGAEPSNALIRVLKIFRSIRLACFLGAGLFLAYGVWTVVTVDMGLGGSMALIIFPAGAIFIALLGALPYGLAQLLLSPARQSNESGD